MAGNNKTEQMYWERMARQLPILGKAGQEKIASTSLSVVGSGGSGSNFAMQSCQAGFRKMTLIDPDTLELSNLNRFALGRLADLGEHKVVVAKRTLEERFPEIEVRTFSQDIRSPGMWEQAKQAAWVIDATDNEAARHYLNEKCVQDRIPLISMGLGFVVDKGRLVRAGCRANRVWVDDACLACQVLGDNEPMDLTPASLVTANAMTAALALDMLLRQLTQYTDPVSGGEQTNVDSGNRSQASGAWKINFVLFDLLNWFIVTERIIPSPGCPWCEKLNSARK